MRYEIKWPGEIRSAKSAWQVNVFGEASPRQTIRAMALAADRLYLAGSEGNLQVRALADGRLLVQRDLAEPIWDGLAIARGRLYVATRQGQVVCLGAE